MQTPCPLLSVYYFTENIVYDLGTCCHVFGYGSSLFSQLRKFSFGHLSFSFSIPSQLSIYTIADMLRDRFSVADTPLMSVPAPTVVMMEGAINPVLVDTMGVKMSPAMSVWMIGLLGCALFFLVTHLRCRREYQTALPLDNEFIRGWQKDHPTRRKIEIRQSDRIAAPLTYGIFHPVVLLPKQIDWTDETRLRYILTHEFIHVQRLDTLTKLVLVTALCVHWFNPFVWVMFVLANRDIELACDETVVQTFGETMKSAYALTLIGLEEKKIHLAPLVNNFSKNSIEERIVSIMKIKKNSFTGIMLAFVLVAGTTTVFATSANTTDAEVVLPKEANVASIIFNNNSPTIDLNKVADGEIVLNTDPDGGAIITPVGDAYLPNRLDGSVTLEDGTGSKDLEDSGDTWMSISAGKEFDIGKSTWGKGEQITLFIKSERENELEVGIKALSTGTVDSETIKSGTGKVIIPIPADGEYQIIIKNNSRSSAKVSINYIVNGV